jgi:anhydro-N-acetylmuramic acid kinase
MSGTSLDGIDAALVELEGELAELRWTLRAFRTIPYREAQRRAIHDAILAGSAAALCRLHAELGEWLAAAALEVCGAAGIAPADVEVIGSHGQTVWHEPPGARRGATLQLGCPATIAERTGIAVVSDFRARDVAAGGQGAPLVPWADRHLYAAAQPRALVNIGGIANLTRVPARGVSEPLLAFDTGPGNVLLNAAAELASGGAEDHDHDGVRAGRARPDGALLARLLNDAYFRAPPPKSTGRERFGRPLVERIAAERAPATEAAWDTLLATLTALTVESIASALEAWVLPRGVDEVVVTGGGARNPVLMQGLRARCAVPVRTGAEAGIDGDAKEAVAFAALAWAFRRGVAGNVPEATGAAGPRVLGSYTPA